MTESKNPGHEDRPLKKRLVDERSGSRQVIEVVRTFRSDGTVLVETPKKNT